MGFMPALAKFIDFQDPEECARVRAITKEEITEHPNPDFQIRVVEDLTQFYATFALDIVTRIVQARDESRECVLILPVGPVPQYAVAAGIINRLGIDCGHVVSFNMDEYADEDGNTAPPEWAGSFATAMRAGFFGKIDENLRPKDENIHFPDSDNIEDYSKMIADRGGADCCYGGIGWCGHIAFWESSLGHNYETMEQYKAATAQIVELDGMCGPGTTMSWQRFIARLVAHGPVNKFVPGSILQEARTDYTILAGVADDVEIDMS